MKYLKKLLIIAIIVFGLSSCSDSDYTIKGSPNSMTSQFINLEKIAEDNSFGETTSIFRDTHTDVLYIIGG